MASFNIAETTINTEWRVGVLEHLIDRIISTLPAGTITAQDMEFWRREAFEAIKHKYPSTRLTRTQRVHLPPDWETR